MKSTFSAPFLPEPRVLTCCGISSLSGTLTPWLLKCLPLPLPCCSSRLGGTVEFTVCTSAAPPAWPRSTSASSRTRPCTGGLEPGSGGGGRGQPSVLAAQHRGEGLRALQPSSSVLRTYPQGWHRRWVGRPGCLAAVSRRPQDYRRRETQPSVLLRYTVGGALVLCCFLGVRASASWTQEGNRVGSPAVERRCGPAGGCGSEEQSRNPREESRALTHPRRAAGPSQRRSGGQLRKPVSTQGLFPSLSPETLGLAGQGPKRRGAGGWEHTWT